LKEWASAVSLVGTKERRPSLSSIGSDNKIQLQQAAVAGVLTAVAGCLLLPL